MCDWLIVRCIHLIYNVFKNKWKTQRITPRNEVIGYWCVLIMTMQRQWELPVVIFTEAIDRSNKCQDSCWNNGALLRATNINSLNTNLTVHNMVSFLIIDHFGCQRPASCSPTLGTKTVLMLVWYHRVTIITLNGPLRIASLKQWIWKTLKYPNKPKSHNHPHLTSLSIYKPETRSQNRSWLRKTAWKHRSDERSSLIWRSRSVCSWWRQYDTLEVAQNTSNAPFSGKRCTFCRVQR